MRVEPAPRLPRSLLWVCAAVVVAAVAMAVVGSSRSGISWDEPYHVMRLRNYFDHGSYALDWAFAGDGPTSDATNTAVYGPVAMLVLHGLTVVLGVEAWGEVSASASAYEVRHLGVVMIGLVGTAAAAATTRILLGCWRWALFTAAALLALPMWTGHLMFNIKDVPVATGYTVMTLALVAMLSPSVGHRVVRVVGLAAGVVLMVGTRPAMLSAVVAGLALIAAFRVAAPRLPQVRTTLHEAVLGVGVAAAVLLLVYPTVFAHPALLLQSTEQSASFRDGRSAVYGYVPFHVLAQVPLLLQGFFVVGLLVSVRFIQQGWRREPVRAVQLTLVGLQLALLPLLAIALHSDVYNGLRQLLFASPAWAVVVTVGAAKALGRAQTSNQTPNQTPKQTHKQTPSQTRTRTRTMTGLVAAALLLPMLDQAQLFPYQYTYFNVALDATGVHVASDYWRTSVPELMPRIPTDGQIVCGPTRSGNEKAPEAMVAGRYSSDSSVDCRIDPLGPLAPAWVAGGLPLTSTIPHDEFYVIIDRDHPVPSNCEREAGVTRERHLREIQMTYVARCRLAPSPLDATPVTFTRPALEPNMLPGPWAFAPQGWVLRDSPDAIDAPGVSASLTFTAPARCVVQACALVVEGDSPPDLAATVNDVGADVQVGLGSAIVRLAPGTADAWVTLRRTSGVPLALRVHSIRVLPLPTKTLPTKT
ncbi:hypothetical protein [Nocardioides sp.]|uniref:hypothetical protein n=1 Tax=Nocardioides sp. TaxID=35761 RepID=UPI003D124B24